MPFDARVLLAFIASPGDLTEDRDQVEAAMHEWNRQHAAREKVVILPQRWEWAAARQGGDGQSQINEQQVRNSDIVLALFWTKLGQSTARAASGTAEEISLGEHFEKPTHVLICTRPVPPGDSDPVEYERLKSYLQEVRSRGLTKDYKSVSDLRREVNTALWSALESLRMSGVLEAKEATLTAAPSNTPQYASNLGVLADKVDYSVDDEDLDYIVRALTAFADVLSEVTHDARGLLAEIVRNGGRDDFGHTFLSVREVERRLNRRPAEVFDLAQELDRFGLATWDDEEQSIRVVLEDEPANLEWDFWNELRLLEKDRPGLISRVVRDLRFDLLDSAAAEPTPLSDVRWSIARKSKSSFVLRNVGTSPATGVSVSFLDFSGATRDLPKGVEVLPQRSVEFSIIESWGEPVPNEILVHSDQHESPEIVPILS